MNKSFCRTTGALIWLSLTLLTAPMSGWAVDATFDLIQTKTAVYSNVTVTTKAAGYIVIHHATGLTSLKVAELSPELHEALGYGPVKGSPNGVATVSAKARAIGDVISTKQIEDAWSKHAPTGTPRLKLNSTVIFAVLAVLAVMYLGFCYCGSLICKKAGKPAGFLIWVPILQYIPLFRAANMSPLWLLAMFVPILNIVAHIMWSFKIAGVRGQGLFTAIFLILPTYPLAFMYLAFAGATPDSDEVSPPKKLAVLGMRFDQA